MSAAEIFQESQVPRRGRKAKPLRAAIIRELTPADIAALVDPETTLPKATVKSLRQSHHTIAKLLAQGTKRFEVASITGVTPARIQQLQEDPQFCELLAHYRGLEETLWERSRAELHDRLKALGTDSIETLHERLMEDDSQFSHKELMAIAELTLDRTGYGKTSTVNVNQTVLDERTIARLRSAIEEKTVVTEEVRHDLLRLARRATEVHPDEQEAEWVESGGLGVRAEGGEGAEEPETGEGSVS